MKQDKTAHAAYGTKNGTMSLADLQRFVEKALALGIDPEAVPTATIKFGGKVKSLIVSSA